MNLKQNPRNHGNLIKIISQLHERAMTILVKMVEL